MHIRQALCTHMLAKHHFMQYFKIYMQLSELLYGACQIIIKPKRIAIDFYRKNLI